MNYQHQKDAAVALAAALRIDPQELDDVADYLVDDAHMDHADPICEASGAIAMLCRALARLAEERPCHPADDVPPGPLTFVPEAHPFPGSSFTLVLADGPSPPMPACDCNHSAESHGYVGPGIASECSECSCTRYQPWDQ